VLVVGGARGIGRAIALQFARSGARVLVNYVRSADSASSLQELAAAEQLQIEVIRADVSMDKGREQLVAETLQRAGTLHTVVFAAATGVHRPLDAVSGRHFDFVVALNVRAFLLLVQALLPAMSQGGSIIALSSEGAERVMPQYGLVSATKAALEALCRQWAVELAPRGIRANVISPGAVKTDAWKALPDADARLAAAIAATPRGSLTTVDEVAQVAQFLASAAASGITAQTLIVDGGARVLGSG
jgi:enoyl-[acyl-carrier protein] reductase III